MSDPQKKTEWPAFLFAIPRRLYNGQGDYLKRFEQAVSANAQALVFEIKQTRELASLLTKSTHTTLTDEEWGKVRLQLTEILKAIPALAIFALPGGMILLPILFRFLPEQMRPRSFPKQKSEKTTP